jgi:hypothetical protein
LDQDTIL